MELLFYKGHQEPVTEIHRPSANHHSTTIIMTSTSRLHSLYALSTLICLASAFPLPFTHDHLSLRRQLSIPFNRPSFVLSDAAGTITQTLPSGETVLGAPPTVDAPAPSIGPVVSEEDAALFGGVPPSEVETVPEVTATADELFNGTAPSEAVQQAPTEATDSIFDSPPPSEAITEPEPLDSTPPSEAPPSLRLTALEAFASAAASNPAALPPPPIAVGTDNGLPSGLDPTSNPPYLLYSLLSTPTTINFLLTDPNPNAPTPDGGPNAPVRCAATFATDDGMMDMSKLPYDPQPCVDVVTGVPQSASLWAWQVVDYAGPGLFVVRVWHGYLDPKYALSILLLLVMLSGWEACADEVVGLGRVLCRRMARRRSATRITMASTRSMLAWVTWCAMRWP
jgi:hypothetical protein